MKIPDSLKKILRLEQLDKKKIFLIILACIFLAYIDFLSLMALQIKSIKTINAKVLKLKKDIDNFNKDLATMQNLKNKEPQLLLNAKKFITIEQRQLLLQYISDMANENNVKILEIKPISGKDEKVQGLRYGVEVIALTLSCAYHSLGKFINTLENAQYFLSIEELKIAKEPNDYLSQKVNVVLKTYVKK